MEFYILDPEVSGSFDERTDLDVSSHPPTVRTLVYQFDGWLGDDLISSFPVFLVTERLANEIERLDLTGYLFDNLEVSTSKQFEILYPNQKLPKFKWLKVVGLPCKDDFGISSDQRLVVSASGLNCLRLYSLQYCDIEAFHCSKI
ncbi:hypothetical protein [Dyadobacter crusticola]|uniref:hypothetical protein n=1 Tax=Dyadobacter crusticola TaxID=292407 RepID=UPI0004E12349|nr:hypothetical protein [Dyadobacter crusticola]